MKRCPRCGQTYTDSEINFCLNDGELLSYLAEDAPKTLIHNAPPSFVDDSPPTEFLKQPRVTNATNWPQHSPLSRWESQPLNIRDPSYPVTPFYQSRDQTLPTVSLILGIGAFLMICCQGGLWLGLPAAIVGFLGMRNADKDPQRYTGRGMAIAGMITGTIAFLISVIWIIFLILA